MAKSCAVSSHACGNLWEVCEGPDLAFTREEIKIVKRGKWLKEPCSLGSSSMEM